MNVRAARALAFAAPLCVGVAAQAAAVDWLVFAIDRSRSIDADELILQRRAYVDLLSDERVRAVLGDAKVAIVEFDSSAEVIVDWADPATAARLYEQNARDERRGQTAIGSAISTALDLLAGKNGRMVIDVSGDGRENVDPARLAAGRKAALQQGVEINGLAIVTDEMPAVDRYYSERVVNGFALSVRRHEDFLEALKRKFLLEVAGLLPDPATVLRE